MEQIIRNFLENIAHSGIGHNAYEQEAAKLLKLFPEPEVVGISGGAAINYQKEVQKVYPKAYGQFAMGHCIITDGNGNSISDLIKGIDKSARNESWENAYNRIQNKGK